MVEEKRAKKQKRKPNKLKKKPNPSGSSEPDSSKSITDPDNAQQSTAVTAQELIQIAQTAHANSSKQRGTAKDIFYKIVFYFERHSQVIDVFIQQEPKFTAIVWGSIRYLLRVYILTVCTCATALIRTGHRGLRASVRSNSGRHIVSGTAGGEMVKNGAVLRTPTECRKCHSLLICPGS
jgi:hypothetical protein